MWSTACYSRAADRATAGGSAQQCPPFLLAASPGPAATKRGGPLCCLRFSISILSFRDFARIRRGVNHLLTIRQANFAGPRRRSCRRPRSTRAHGSRRWGALEAAESAHAWVCSAKMKLTWLCFAKHATLSVRPRGSGDLGATSAFTPVLNAYVFERLQVWVPLPRGRTEYVDAPAFTVVKQRVAVAKG